MRITRQHSETEMQELYGKTCHALLAVVEEEKNNIAYFLYLRTDKTWHRFSLDAGVLFWDENEAPDPEDDISGSVVYRELGTELKLVNKTLNKIKMENGQLEFCVEDGTGFQLVDLEDGILIKI